MSNARWKLRVLVAALLSVGGCGGSATSTEKSYDHFVAAAKALETGDKETAITELSATIDKSPNDWAYFERARLLAEQGKDQEAAADVQAEARPQACENRKAEARQAGGCQGLEGHGVMIR